MSQLIGLGIEDQFDRLPPNSIDGERCLLASLMLDRELFGQIISSIDRDSFYLADHQILFDILRQLWDENRPIDAVIVFGELEKRHLLEEIGGKGYLAKILGAVPSAAHGAHYARIVREKSLLRQLISASNGILGDAYAPHEQADLVVDKAEKRIFEIAEKKTGGTIVSLGEVAHEVYDKLYDKGPKGIHTGFLELDDMMNGLQNGEMIIIAGRPSMGKTAFAMNIVEHVAADLNLPCGIFSLEMSRQQLAQRIMCSRANMDAQKVRKSNLSAQDYQHLAATVNALAKAPIWLDDSPGLTPLELRAKARRMVAQHDIKCLMIDYMQLMDNPGPESRQQQISEISRAVKSVARELKIPVICLSQLNRAAEGRDGHRPRMSDLRESGSIEQDADVVILLHREDYYHLGEQDYLPDNCAEAIVVKQRNGPTGTVKLTFLNKSTRFENRSSAEEYQ